MARLLTREEAREEQARLDEAERRDWFEMMQVPAAERIWLQLLQELGAGRLMVTENDMRMRNVADQILDRMARAVPGVYVRIVCKLQGISQEDTCSTI